MEHRLILAYGALILSGALLTAVIVLGRGAGEPIIEVRSAPRKAESGRKRTNDQPAATAEQIARKGWEAEGVFTVREEGRRRIAQSSTTSSLPGVGSRGIRIQYVGHGRIS